MASTSYHEIDLLSLPTKDFQEYQNLILPSAQFLFQNPQEPNSQIFAFEARQGDNLIGLIIAQFYSYNKNAQIYSWMVKESFRGKKIGQTLFKMMIEWIEEKEGFAVGFEFEKESPYAPIIEKILKFMHWNPSITYLIRCYFGPDFNPLWYQEILKKKLPEDLELFYWKDLKPYERKRIEFEADQGMFVPHLSPLQKEDKIEYKSSLGIRFKDRVIGWCIVHHEEPTLDRFSILYTSKDYQFKGIAPWLLAQSIKIHLELVPNALFEMNLEEIDLTWLSFVRKRLIPYAKRVEKINWAMKFIRQ